MWQIIDARHLLDNHVIAPTRATRPVRLSPSTALAGLSEARFDPDDAFVSALALDRQRRNPSMARFEEALRRGEAMRGQEASSAALWRVNQGVRIVDTALQGLSSIRDKLAEMLTLAEEGKGASLVGEDRERIIQRFEMLKHEVDVVTHTTEFDGRRLLDGSLSLEPITLDLGLDGSRDDTYALGFEEASSHGLALIHLEVHSQQGAEGAETELKQVIASFEVRHQGAAEQSRQLLQGVAERHESAAQFNRGLLRQLDEVKQDASAAREQATRDASSALVAQATTQPAIALRLLS